MRDLIDKLEFFNEELSDTKRYMIHAAVVVISAIIWLVTLSIPIFQSQSSLMQERDQIISQVDAINMTQFEVRKNSLIQQQLQKASEVEEYRQEFVSQMSRYQREEFVKFSNARMTQFLDLAMKASLRHNLVVESVENIALDDELFAHSIEIQGVGAYLDIIEYLHRLLGYKAVVSLQEFAISTNELYNVEFVLLFYFGGE